MRRLKRLVSWQAEAPAPLLPNLRTIGRSRGGGGRRSIFEVGTKRLVMTSFSLLLRVRNTSLTSSSTFTCIASAISLRGCIDIGRMRSRLELLKSGDQRVIAAGLSLGQDLAGNSCVTFSMVGDLERAAESHGDRGYRYVHFQAGAIGHRLYLAAESLGFQSTGIGAFFDDSVHRIFGDRCQDSGRQVVYHFALRYAVPDAAATRSGLIPPG